MTELKILEADVCCPKCKHQFRVRHKTTSRTMTDEEAQVFNSGMKEVDEHVSSAFGALDKIFKKVFGDR